METAKKSAPEVEYQERFITARDGIRLFFRRWARPRARGTIGLVHGFAEHCGRYDQLAGALTDAGWSVAAMDYRGHGQSGGRRAHIDRFGEYLDDIHAFLDEIDRDGGNGRPALLGHSQGGLIAARFAEITADRISMLVLSSPFLGLAMKVPAPKVWLGRLVSRWLPTLAIPTGLDSAWLSHDQQIVDTYSADPLVSHHATARWFTEVTQAQEETYQDAGRLALPLLVLQAGQDRLSSIEATRRFAAAAGSADKRIEVYPDLFHEIFNEVGRESVFADLTAWLEQHAG
jgi:alpha-beta hydrolase superfamily lysophospholipase